MPLNSRNRGYESRLNHSVGEKMAVVHFTTMPCKPYSAHKVQRIESHIFAIVVPVIMTLRMLGLKILKLFCTFL